MNGIKLTRIALMTLSLALTSLSAQGAPDGIHPGATFVYAIANGTTSYSVEVVFVDLFDASASTISKLKQSGKTVVCYYSAGSGENWRPDYKKLPASALGNAMSGWAGEKWLDTRNATVLSIMKSRQALAQSKGCQGVDPDNVDGYANSTGFPLSSRDQKNYLEALTQDAHARGLKIGLKNSSETAWDLQPLFDFVVIEECFKYKECAAYKSFGQNKKPMFQIEYTKKSTSQCQDAAKAGGTLVFANLDLTKFTFCP